MSDKHGTAEMSLRAATPTGSSWAYPAKTCFTGGWSVLIADRSRGGIASLPFSALLAAIGCGALLSFALGVLR